VRLGAWSNLQRNRYASGLLSPERVAALDALGFEWHPDRKDRSQTIWNQRLAELADFKCIHGHCRVSQRDKRLYAWVSQQRKLFKIGVLPSDRIALLEALNFEWHVKEAPAIRKETLPVIREKNLAANKPSFHQEWLDHYLELEAFKAQYGHCRVPYDHPAHRRLGRWIYCQRNLHAKGRLSPEKVAALEALGFEWLATESEIRPKKVLAVRKQS
jgi:hypothetical protein